MNLIKLLIKTWVKLLTVYINVKYIFVGYNLNNSLCY